jgi:hypothetical protein
MLVVACVLVLMSQTFSDPSLVTYAPSPFGVKATAQSLGPTGIVLVTVLSLVRITETELPP